MKEEKEEEEGEGEEEEKEEEEEEEEREEEEEGEGLRNADHTLTTFTLRPIRCQMKFSLCYRYYCV